MRHLKAGRKLGRTSAHRKALFRNLVGALILRERISTTLAKAKELRGKVEKTITLGKKGTLHARRQAFKLAPQKETVLKVFGPLAERYAKRPGGYTRIIKIGPRKGDNAPMVFIELVDRKGDSPVPGKGKSAAKKEAPKTAEKKDTTQKTDDKKIEAKKETQKETQKETKDKEKPKKGVDKDKEDKK
jgi:large subunit ribosomal protein L17